MNRTFPVVNIGGARLGAREAGPLPMPDGALYRHPNPDGSRKACRNCIFFIVEKDRCALHSPDLKVTDDLWCGYHIFGPPTGRPHEGMQTVTPDISGLRPVGAGAACGGCRFYEDQGGGKGLCWGVSKPDDRRPPAPVETLGVCARYEGM